MKIGLIADIHGDEAGLRRALDLLDGLGAERILCAGDLVERGSRGDAVIDLIRQRGIPCVKGNHEYIMLSKQESLEETGSPGGLGSRCLTRRWPSSRRCRTLKALSLAASRSCWRTPRPGTISPLSTRPAAPTCSGASSGAPNAMS